VLLLLALSLRRPPRRGADIAADSATEAAEPVGRARWLGWFALAALGSYALVAVTNHLTQNIPSFPMMWVLPLVLYLASFTLCFDSDRWTHPTFWRAATLLALGSLCALLWQERQIKVIAWQIGGFLLGLFVLCMFCHGELARSRPLAARLTTFYLAVSAGGVAGGALVALGAPLLLPGYFEVEAGLVLLALALLWRCAQHGPAPAAAGRRAWVAAAAVVLLATVATTAWRVQETGAEVVAMSRNFFGVVRVREYGSPAALDHERVLVHGRIMHGQQFLHPERRRQPTSYYTESSGVGRLLTALADRPIEVAAIGLGAGTIATYGKAGDVYRFYEIDPAIVDAAQQWFSFLGDSPAKIEIAVGDGRLLLQADADRRFDVIVVDAFSGDAIPVHLLTREAVQLYLQRLKPGGVIALHISNSHLNLRPVVARIAAELGLQTTLVADPGVEGDVSRSVSDWVLLARERGVLDAAPIAAVSLGLAPAPPGARTWTDDFSNIVELLSFGRNKD
jgi:protein-L-isoaspartate O-methyltransferase